MLVKNISLFNRHRQNNSTFLTACRQCLPRHTRSNDYFRRQNKIFSRGAVIAELCSWLCVCRLLRRQRTAQFSSADGIVYVGRRL